MCAAKEGLAPNAGICLQPMVSRPNVTSEPTDHAAVYSKSLRTIAGHRAALAGGRGALVERLLGGGRELVKHQIRV